MIKKEKSDKLKSNGNMETLKHSVETGEQEENSLYRRIESIIFGQNSPNQVKLEGLNKELAGSWRLGEVDAACDFDNTMVGNWPLFQMVAKAVKGMSGETIQHTYDRMKYVFNLESPDYQTAPGEGWETLRQIAGKAWQLVDSAGRIFWKDPRLTFLLLANRRQTEIEQYIQEISANTKINEECLRDLQKVEGSGVDGERQIVIVSRNSGQLIEAVVRQNIKLLEKYQIKIVGIIANYLNFDQNGRCRELADLLVRDYQSKRRIIPPEISYYLGSRDRERKVLAGTGLSLI